MKSSMVSVPVRTANGAKVGTKSSAMTPARTNLFHSRGRLGMASSAATPSTRHSRYIG